MLIVIFEIDDVSKKLGVSEQYVRRLISTKKLSATRDGKKWKISKKNLENFLESTEFIINPNDQKNKQEKKPKIIALSFFSGAMGLDLGMEQAGIKPVLTSEIDKYARATILKNNPDIGLIGDIWKYSTDQIREYAGIGNKKIDVIFGGPPCQAFSTAGRRKGFADERGSVFLRYIDIIGKLKPKYAVLENVRGLQTTKAALEETNGIPVKGGALFYALTKLQKFGYSVSFNLYNAANFGAPQKRDRFVIIAKLGKNKVDYLTPTNSDNPDDELPTWKTLGDAINDIQNTTMHYVEIPKSRKEWFKKIPEGGNWKSLTIEDQKKAMGNKFKMGGGKTGFFRRLAFNKPSPTLVTVPTMPATDLVHPKELRPLSVEEYARVQGFPDNWIFCGNISEKYKQIGNAVPISLAKAIGETIINDMDGKHTNSYVNFKYSRYKNTSEKDFPSLFKKNFEKAKNKENIQLSLHF
ncbi:DNA (cytosine-5-)-methyltransferase [Lactobacillus reuteri]|nr:DNA (cytosine-5-)-methyltransferase [Limosilactobacillus reuteri]MQC03507.1 DNA (cytosine-5-)-methyltransferase [Limosilactobacillus reuteri]